MNTANTTDTTFRDLGLPEHLCNALTTLGFTHPTAIQASAIPFLLSGRDVLGVAQTGTGKTAAFGLPLLATINPDVSAVQGLVLAPTRELAMQGAEAISSFASASQSVDVVAVYGGSSYGPQLRALKNGAQVVVGTPGRIMDLIERGALQLDSVRFFVLDEADEMLRMGFAEDVEVIASSLPADRVSALFSATMPPAIRRVAGRHLTNPEEVAVSRPASTVSTIRQTYALVPHQYKTAALARVLSVRQADAVLVFVATRAMAEELSLDLGARGIQAAALSGDVPQKDREKLVARLKSGGLDVIIATDVAARGLDVERVGLVVNYDVPRESDTYVHRIGRTGRAGREGEALTFITSRELPRLRRIQKATQAHLEEVKIPTSWEVSRFNAERLLDAAQQRVSLGNLDVYADVLEEYRASREDADTFAVPTGDAAPHEHTHSFVSDGQLLAALLALGIRDAGSLDRDVPDIISDNIASSDKSGSKKKKKTRKSRDVQDGYTRYRVEVGHRDKVRPGAIVGALANEGGLSGSLIGSIDIYPTFSLVEIAGDIPSETWERLSRIRVSGRQLRISRDRGPVARHEDTGNGKENRSDLSLGRRSKKGRDKARGRKGSHNFKSQKKKRNRR